MKVRDSKKVEEEQVVKVKSIQQKRWEQWENTHKLPTNICFLQNPTLHYLQIELGMLKFYK